MALQLCRLRASIFFGQRLQIRLGGASRSTLGQQKNPEHTLVTIAASIGLDVTKWLALLKQVNLKKHHSGKDQNYQKTQGGA